jgi:hypothetical protein
VPDVGAFDPSAYLHARLADKKPEARIEDPLVREYIRFMLKCNLELWRDEVEGAHNIRADIPVCGNQGSGDMAAYPTVLLSDASDLIFLENSRRAYPNNPNTIYYALALAGGRHAKPAWIWDFGTPEYMEQVDHSLLFVAECYATGATPYYEMNNLAHSSRKGYYPIALGGNAYEALKGYARFAREHREMLTRGYRAEARVALLYSVPSFVPRRCGALGAGLGQQAAPFIGFARFMERTHIPYNAEILGDEELWPDRNLTERLSRYAVLVCPNVVAMSDTQAEAIRKFLAERGRIIVSGDLGTRDEGFARRNKPVLDDLKGDSGRGKVSWLKDEPDAYLTAHAVQEARGASQQVVINQTEAKPLVIRGWSKCKDVSGASDGEYSIWVDLTYTDGTPLWAQVAKFKTGTHDWQQAESVIYPAKPLKSATVHALFRYHSGTVWFDDLFFGEEGGPNLLKNPGFEGGDARRVPDWQPFIGWQKFPAGYVPDTQAHAGAGSIRCEIPKSRGDSPVALRLAQVFQDALGAPARRPAGGDAKQMEHGAKGDIETDAPSTVFIRPVRFSDRMVVHLLNYDYDGGQDKINPVGGFRLALRLPGDCKNVNGDVMLATPDAPGQETVLPHRLADGRIEVQVPKLHIWSVLYFRL